MSMETRILKLNDCIGSQLWYTAHVVSQISKNKDFCTDIGITEFNKLIGHDEYPLIIYKLISTFGNEESMEGDIKLKLEIFKKTLIQIDENIQNDVKQELIKLYEAVITASCESDATPPSLSKSTLNFLERNLWRYPVIVHWIINQMLCIWSTAFTSTDSALQDVFLNVLKEILKEARMIGVKKENEFSRVVKNVNFISESHAGILMCILSRLDVTELKEHELYTWLYPMLFKTCKFEEIELAFYSKKNPEFFRIWHKYLDETCARNENPDDLDKVLRIYSAIFDVYEDNLYLNPTEIFTRIIRRQRHWLEDIQDVCIILAKEKKLEELSKILSSPILPNFSVIFALKLFNDCSEIDISIFKSVLTCGFNSWKDETMNRLEKILNNHLNALEWIQKNKKLKINEKTVLKNILPQLQKSTILSVLTKSVDLDGQNFDEVKSLINDCEESKIVYQSYCAMLSAFKAILLCDSYSFEFEIVAELYSDMEKYLNTLYPFETRLEVIENIFSMLFMRHEDFIENDSISDCGDDDDDDELFDEPEDSATKQKKSTHNRIGFICNKYAIRETIHYLNRCIFVAKNDLNYDTKGSDYIAKRISTLQTFLTEAIWRLELLTSSEFFKRQGLPDTSPQSPIVTPKIVNSSVYLSKTFYKPDESSSDENELRSDIDLSSENGSFGNGTSNNSGKRRRQLRSSTSTTDSIGKDFKGSKECTLRHMLATRETLVLRCLWKNDYSEAQRVIETFGMENTRLAGEILFSQAMRAFRLDIENQVTVVDPPKIKKTQTRRSTMEMIRKAAKDGVQASRTINRVETFLASQESNILLSSDRNNSKELMTLTTMDLALTVPQDYLTSEKLLEVAMKHCHSCEQLNKTHYIEFFQTIYRLHQLKKNESSVPKILCDARIPLSLKELKEKTQYWQNLSEKLKVFENEMRLIDLIDMENSDRKTQLENILSICGDEEPYLRKLMTHLDILRTIAPKVDDYIEDEIKSSLLENSLDLYIGHQIFHLKINLEELEKIANKLQVNLVYSILVNCCPKLICINEHDNRRKNQKWGTIVLNKSIKIIESNIEPADYTDPNLCVVDILMELIQFLKNHFFNESILHFSDIKNLFKNSDISNILSKTIRLATLDLSYLSFGNHTLAFFLNIWNLLILHTIIEVWSQDPPMNSLRHEISMKTIGYEIGDLGYVTLFSLRTKLLGQDLCDHELWFNNHAEELNEPAWQDLDLQPDPRVIFAMINEYKRTPILSIFDSDSLNNCLDSASQDYLNFYYSQDNEESVVYLPKFLQGAQSFLKTYFHENKKGLEFKPVEYSYDIKIAYDKENKIDEEKDQISEKISGSIIVNRSWKERKVEDNLLQYLEGHCWLLSYLVQRIHDDLQTIQDKNYDNPRTAVLEKLLNSTWSENLKCLFGMNRSVAGLQNFISASELWKCFEEIIANKKFVKCLSMIDSLPESFMMNNIEVQRFRDKVLTQIIIDLDVNNPGILQYLYQIRDEQVLAKIVLSKVKEWPVRVCEDALRHTLSHNDEKNIPAHSKSEMNEILCRVMVFDKILPYCKKENDNIEETTWYNVVYRTEKTDPVRIVKSLIDAKQFELCLEWLEYQTASSEIQSLVSRDLFIGLLKNEKDDFKQAKKLLRALPNGQSIKLCKRVIEKLESMNALRFVIGYLLENSSEKEKYQKGSLGVEILDKLDSRDRPGYIHLINEPLLMLEQLLMNCKFDSLHRILYASSDKLVFSTFSTNDFDEIVRFYAKKSLDLRVAIQRDTLDAKLKDGSLNLSTEFIMPVNIPTREEWVPNEKSRECSCCKTVIFSMFNRRHHCRRCGRVICAACSSQRMQVAGYTKSVLVRVCNDCKYQTALQQQAAQGALSTPSSEAFDSWKLTCDQSHNKTLREEFCFEYAPNISLCLAILNLHSDHEAYANFLQDRCDEMKTLLYPDSKGRINPEIDHGLIIKMIRSLLVAAKVKCAKLGWNTGLTHCDRFLSQVDLIATLVASDCLSLIPRDNLDEHALRRLRDLLTEKEQWVLALDVSTKSGLDTQCVWAAWGKACLKVGYYDKAREKFAHCLDKVQKEDFDDWVVLTHSGESTSDQNKYNKIDKDSSEKKETKILKNRPSKDPPLLIEILQILEVSNSIEQYSKNQSTNTKISTAQEVLGNLNSIKAILHGQYIIPKLNSNTRNIRYQESLYYLLMYGGFNSILEFFIKYEEFDKCLSYILENDIEPEVFFNVVFMGCIKNGKLTNLCDTMRSKDSSLLIWKKYLIFICHYLERKQFFNTLYQIQLFMKDYIRAAMTCIRFYVTDASSYTDLCTRTHHLADAQKHLETELQVEAFSSKRRRKSTSSNTSGHGGGSFTMEMEPSEIDKHINTISRQMEIAKFLGSCEKEERSVGDYLSKLSFMESEGLMPRSVPTLFGNQQERTHLAVLAILCGRDVEEGFGIAFRIMQDYNLRPQKVYSLVGHILALDKKVDSIEQLIKCCRSSGAPNSTAISDRVLAHCVKLLLDRSKAEASPNPSPKDQIDSLIRIITDVELKIGSYIESRQLKAAYLLAVKHSRVQDIRKILREADRLGQTAIMSICKKWLQQTSNNWLN